MVTDVVFLPGLDKLSPPLLTNAQDGRHWGEGMRDGDKLLGKDPDNSKVC